ncbi:(2Fe-2S)-binding protein [Candidatus Poriferisodalis sp.]|uniref:(2Fe-2S)-binding protein n=1 Tax=Candidatus Poriferisodalis sp. TaxID=3101277 RepID=UPI003B5904AC
MPACAELEIVASMIICQCLATNETAIRHLVAQGATTALEIGAACGAGTDCGSCVGMIRAVLEQCRLELMDPEHTAVHSIAFDTIAVGV